MMTAKRRFLCALVLLASLAGACTEKQDDAQIVIVVDTDFRVPADINRVDFWINRVGADESQAQVVNASLGGRIGVKLPLILTIAPASDASTPVEVRVEGVRAESNSERTLVVRRKARVRFQRGQTLMLRMDLVQSCAAPKFLECEQESETTTCDPEGCASSEAPDSSKWNGDPNTRSPVVGRQIGRDANDGGLMSDAAGADAGSDATSGDASTADAGDGTDPDLPVELALGDKHSCVRTLHGKVYCWGKGDYGELGDGLTDHGATCMLKDSMPAGCSWSPVKVVDLPPATQLSAGVFTTCAIHQARPNFGGNVSCWGEVLDGVTAAKPTPLVYEDVNVANAAEVRVGGRHSCVRRTTELPICWGEYGDGELGNGDNSTYPGRIVLASQLVGLVTPPEISKLAVGGRHTCVLKTSGELLCWGNNEYGQAGQPLTSERLLMPALVQGITGATGVFAGDALTCVHVAGEGAYCFGDDTWGQLGSNQEGTVVCQEFALCTPAPKRVRIETIGASDIAQITGGTSFTCARLPDGRASCWGNNEVGQLGPQIVTTSRKVPVALPAPLDKVIDVAAAAFHACAILADHSVVCWGINDAGQLGASPMEVTQTAVPVRVPLQLE